MPLAQEASLIPTAFHRYSNSLHNTAKGWHTDIPSRLQPSHISTHLNCGDFKSYSCCSNHRYAKVEKPSNGKTAAAPLTDTPKPAGPWGRAAGPSTGSKGAQDQKARLPPGSPYADRPAPHPAGTPSFRQAPKERAETRLQTRGTPKPPHAPCRAAEHPSWPWPQSHRPSRSAPPRPAPTNPEPAWLADGTAVTGGAVLTAPVPPPRAGGRRRGKGKERRF